MQLNRAAALRGIDGDLSSVAEIWPDPIPVPDALLPVQPFDVAMLPEPFQPWVADIAERMQAPADFIGVTAMVAAGSVIGRKIGVRPQRHTDWHEVPNLWGCIVGRPGVMKSPSMKQAMAPLYRLEAEAREDHRKALTDFKAGEMIREMSADAAKAAIKKRLASDPKDPCKDLLVPPEEEPKGVRYIANDAHYQALAELLRNSATNGILAFRDELLSLLKSLDDEGKVEDRGFFLTGWNGADSYTSDRLGRGMNLHIPAVTISLLGSTQPGKIREYVSRAVNGGESDDGLIQRFGMTVWPDLDPNWREVDREPDARSRSVAFRAFDRLSKLTPEMVGANVDEYHPDRAYLRFDPEAQELFSEWWQSLEMRLRGNGLHPAMESHLAKYRKLIPTLALIHHVVSEGFGSIPKASLLAACAWGAYLESHAHRIYGAAIDNSAEGASLILKRIKSGKLASPFTVRDLHNKGWAGLTDRTVVQRAVERLEDHHYLRLEESMTGGRPSLVAVVSPKFSQTLRRSPDQSSDMPC